MKCSSAALRLENFARRIWHDSPQPELRLPWPLRILLAILGGACVFLAFPDFNQFYLAYIALFLELWAVEGLKPKSAFFVGWLAGAVTNIGGFYWVGSLLKDFAHMPTWLSMTLCLAFGILQGSMYGIWTWGVRKLHTRSIWLTACALFVAVEMFFPMLFPWFYANSQYNFIPAVQVADLFGVLGVSLLLCVFNVLLFDISRTLILRRRGENVPFDKIGLCVGGAYLLFAAIYAPIRIHQIDKIQDNAPKMEIGMVESDVGIWEIESPEKVRNSLFTHQSLAAKLQGVDLIVWPESSYQAGLIWGSELHTDYPLEHELDAMFATWFQPTARLIYNTIDSAFGIDFHKNPTIRRAIMDGIEEMARERNFETLDRFYPSLVSGYPFPCKQNDKQIMKCPYNRVVPDDLTYYIPSVEPLRDSRKSDLLKMIRPEDISSPIRGFNAALIFGTLSVEYTQNVDVKDFKALYQLDTAHRKLYNTAHFVAPDGRVLGKYHKNYPLMFGEYLPFSDTFPWLYDLIPEAGNLSAGTSFDTFEYKGFKLAPIICYEDILPRYVNKISALNANVFVNVTNDAWFGKTAEPALHLALAMMRSVEHRKWLVRSTNTGISAFIDPNGRMVQHTSIYEPEILRQSVAMMPPHRTLYSYIGDLIGWISLAWLAFLTCLKIWFFRKNSNEIQKTKNT